MFIWTVWSLKKDPFQREAETFQDPFFSSTHVEKHILADGDDFPDPGLDHVQMEEDAEELNDSFVAKEDIASGSNKYLVTIQCAAHKS